MARHKKAAPVLSITGAARLLHLNPWQVAHVIKRYHLVPEPPPPGHDRRSKWFQRDVLLACIAREHRITLAAAA